MYIDKNLCDVCGTCASVCPKAAITIKEFEIVVKDELCNKCQNCVKVCPAQALEMENGKWKMENEPVAAELASVLSSNEKQSVAAEFTSVPYQSCINNEKISNPTIHQFLPEEFDVVVVGGGPAGSVTARFIAEQGYSVLILERDREPGIPVRCAEGVSHNGILPFIDINEKWICTRIDGARLCSPNGDSVDMYNNGTGYVLDRRVFDRALADLAVSKGAFMLTKADAIDLLRDEKKKICGVIYQHENRIVKVKSKIVIGADGIESQVGRWAGIKTNLSLSDLETCCQYTVNNINIDKNLCQFYFGREVSPGGYIWIFPKSETQANIGLGIAGCKAKPGQGPRYYLDIFMQKNFPNASINYMVYGGVPTKAGDDFVKDNIMLVGDAAHQVNPITGGGIVQAMIAGKHCADTAVKAIQENNFSAKFLKEYTKKWDEHLGKHQKFLYSLKNKFLDFKDDKFNNLVAMCKRIPQNEFNLHRLFKETIKEDPLLVAQLASSFVVSKIK